MSAGVHSFSVLLVPKSDRNILRLCEGRQGEVGDDGFGTCPENYIAQGECFGFRDFVSYHYLTRPGREEISANEQVDGVMVGGIRQFVPLSSAEPS